MTDDTAWKPVLMVLQHFCENFTSLVDLFVAQRHCWQKSNDGLLRAVDQQSLIEALLHQRRAVDRQFQPDHKTANTQLLHDGRLFDQWVEARTESFANFDGTIEQTFVFDRFNRGDS